MLTKIKHYGLPFIETDAAKLVYYGAIHCYVLLR